MVKFGFHSVFSRLFFSVFLALIVFASAMFIWTQVVNNNSTTLKNRAIARHIVTQIDPFLNEVSAHTQAGNRLQARFSLVVIKKSFDILDKSLNAKIGLYDPNKQLLLETDNSNLPRRLMNEPSWFEEVLPTLSGDIPPFVQIKTSSGYTLWYESRNPPKRSRLLGFFNLFTGTLLLIGIMSFVLWWIARNMTWRINELSEQLQRLGEGDFSVRVAEHGNDEIAMLAHGFNQSAQKIEQLINANNLLLAHASHEFRTPITRMRLQTEMLTMLGDNLNPAQQAMLEKRTNAINRDLTGLNDLIESILLISRLDAGQAVGSLETVNFFELIADECRYYPESTLYGEPIFIQSKPNLITHLIRNLLNNALIHGTPPITVCVYGCQNSDDAIAIPAHLIAQIQTATPVLYGNLNPDYVDNADDLSNEISENVSNNDFANALNNDNSNQSVNELADKTDDLPDHSTDELANKSSENIASNAPKNKVGLNEKLGLNKVFFDRFQKKDNKPAKPIIPNFAVLAVIDEGTGIPADKREDIFSPFVRLKQEKKGSGLGLSLVSQIVEIHGGTILTDTWQGKTRFLVVLPVKERLITKTSRT